MTVTNPWAYWTLSMVVLVFVVYVIVAIIEYRNRR